MSNKGDKTIIPFAGDEPDAPGDKASWADYVMNNGDEPAGKLLVLRTHTWQQGLDMPRHFTERNYDVTCMQRLDPKDEVVRSYGLIAMPELHLAGNHEEQVRQDMAATLARLQEMKTAGESPDFVVIDPLYYSRTDERRAFAQGIHRIFPEAYIAVQNFAQAPQERTEKTTAEKPWPEALPIGAESKIREFAPYPDSMWEMDRWFVEAMAKRPPRAEPEPAKQPPARQLFRLWRRSERPPSSKAER